MNLYHVKGRIELMNYEGDCTYHRINQEIKTHTPESAIQLIEQRIRLSSPPYPRTDLEWDIAPTVTEISQATIMERPSYKPLFDLSAL